MIEKNSNPSIQSWRSYVQLGFVVLTLWIGVEFVLFVNWLESGGVGPAPVRPAGAEAFLPIASLMNLSYWIQTGTIHAVHPAGLFIFLAIITVSWVFGKSFCSWICPFGFLSETLEQAHKAIFKRSFRMPRWLDYPLRSLKYLILGFFLIAIIPMGVYQLLSYLDSPYHAVADVKMFRFFAQITPFALNVIIGLVIASALVPYFWCRYLCPYGALLGITGLLSPNRITRVEDSCIDCAKCAMACPAKILVDQVKRVHSDECTSCMQCVDACPVKDTLVVQSVVGRKRFSTKMIASLVLVLFVLITGIGMLSGNWEGTISPEEYLKLYPGIDSYTHTGG